MSCGTDSALAVTQPPRAIAEPPVFARARAVARYSYPAVGRAFGTLYARILGQ